MDETITLCEDTTQSFMFCTFMSYTLLLKPSNGWKNYALRVYCAKFRVLHIRQVYISIKTFPYCSMKINKVLNKNGVYYATVVWS